MGLKIHVNLYWQGISQWVQSPRRSTRKWGFPVCGEAREVSKLEIAKFQEIEIECPINVLIYRLASPLEYEHLYILQ